MSWGSKSPYLSFLHEQLNDELARASTEMPAHVEFSGEVFDGNPAEVLREQSADVDLLSSARVGTGHFAAYSSAAFPARCCAARARPSWSRRAQPAARGRPGMNRPSPLDGTDVDVAVVTASRHGSTREVADVIAATLREHGHQSRVEDVEGLSGPIAGDAVVIGSPIYMGRWMRAARRVAAALAAEGGGRPVYAFSCGPLGDPPAPEPPEAGEVLGDLAVSVRLYELFGGKLESSDLGRRERMMARAVKAEEGDFRDLGAVREFASRIAEDLTAAG